MFVIKSGHFKKTTIKYNRKKLQGKEILRLKWN